ncbi:MAG: class I SAM-dependent methyltransferase [Pseudomonadales bacterium]|nr:class I SAM-dependent methyltransferase [Pseudomonadales bacterium]
MDVPFGPFLYYKKKNENTYLSAYEIVFITVTLLIVASIVWSTLKVGISPMPSSAKAREVIIQLTVNTGTGPIVDLGSGWGSLIIPLAKKYPQRKIVGYEISLTPWLITKLLKTIFSLNNLELYRKDFLQEELSSAEVLICYLYPEGMKTLANKLTLEKNTTRVLISNYFSLPSQQPEKTIQLDDFYKSPIYLYHLNSERE